MNNPQDSLESIVAERVKATTRIIDKVRRSQDIRTIFEDTTQEMRQVLKCDRLVIYQFNCDWSGQVVAESVGSGWISLLIKQNYPELSDINQISEDRCTVRDWSQGETGDIVEPDSFLQDTRGGKYAFGAKIYSSRRHIR